MREGESQSYDSQLTLGSVALETLSSLRQSWYCSLFEAQTMKVMITQAQRTKEREGSWESQENITRKSLQWRWLCIPKERLHQKPQLLRFMLVQTVPEKQGQ